MTPEEVENCKTAAKRAIASRMATYAAEKLRQLEKSDCAKLGDALVADLGLYIDDALPATISDAKDYKWDIDSSEFDDGELVVVLRHGGETHGVTIKFVVTVDQRLQ